MKTLQTPLTVETADPSADLQQLLVQPRRAGPPPPDRPAEDEGPSNPRRRSFLGLGVVALAAAAAVVGSATHHGDQALLAPVAKGQRATFPRRINLPADLQAMVGSPEALKAGLADGSIVYMTQKINFFDPVALNRNPDELFEMLKADVARAMVRRLREWRDNGSVDGIGAQPIVTDLASYDLALNAVVVVPVRLAPRLRAAGRARVLGNGNWTSERQEAQNIVEDALQMGLSDPGQVRSSQDADFNLHVAHLPRNHPSQNHLLYPIDYVNKIRANAPRR